MGETSRFRAHAAHELIKIGLVGGEFAVNPPNWLTFFPQLNRYTVVCVVGFYVPVENLCFTCCILHSLDYCDLYV